MVQRYGKGVTRLLYAQCCSAIYDVHNYLKGPLCAMV